VDDKVFYVFGRIAIVNSVKSNRIGDLWNHDGKQLKFFEIKLVIKLKISKSF